MSRRMAGLGLAMVTALGASGARAQTPEPLAQAAEEQFQSCLIASPTGPPERASQGEPPPPGLSRRTGVAVHHIPTADGALYAYRDIGGREQICGVAIYGGDPDDIQARLTQMISSSYGDLVVDPPPHYTVRGAVPSTSTYLGDKTDPDVHGVLFMLRKPSPTAPSLEAEVHTVLIH